VSEFEPERNHGDSLRDQNKQMVFGLPCSTQSRRLGPPFHTRRWSLVRMTRVRTNTLPQMSRSDLLILCLDVNCISIRNLPACQTGHLANNNCLMSASAGMRHVCIDGRVLCEWPSTRRSPCAASVSPTAALIPCYAKRPLQATVLM
jgi:hypothetical protein